MTCWRLVARYFFETRDDETFVEDRLGTECRDLEAVKEQAALSLAELALDVLPGSQRRVLTVEVRDETEPVMKAVLSFEATLLLG